MILCSCSPFRSDLDCCFSPPCMQLTYQCRATLVIVHKPLLAKWYRSLVAHLLHRTDVGLNSVW